MAIGDTNNPTGIDGTMPMGPSDDTHVANSDTAASPTFEDTTANMQPNPGPTQRSVYTESTHPPPATINASPKKRRRTSRGPAQAARQAAFIASMEQDTDNTHT